MFKIGRSKSTSRFAAIASLLAPCAGAPVGCTQLPKALDAGDGINRLAVIPLGKEQPALPLATSADCQQAAVIIQPASLEKSAQVKQLAERLAPLDQ